MYPTVALSIDGREITARQGTTIMDAARGGGIYIPALCAHPDLPPAIGQAPALRVHRGGEVRGDSPSQVWEGCQLCVVEVERIPELVTACSTPIAPGMRVLTTTPRVQEKRQDQLSAILAHHPHACLSCAQREGCAREPCSMKVASQSRCCPRLGNCELQRVVEYVGLKKETPRYVFQDLPIFRDEPLFDRNYNLCIGCTRCVRVCRDVRAVGVYDFVIHQGRVVVGTVAPSLKESACRFCGACVEVCPTGALMDRNAAMGEREKVLVPCRNTCPAGVDVPRYVRLIAEGKFAEALAVVRERAPLPTVLGHVCTHPCEEVCRRGQVNQPVAICVLKRFAAENGGDQWKERLVASPPTGKRVTIVGSGPAGLTAAYYLARQGHSVTIIEDQEEAGGMMQAGIPRYRLPLEALQKDRDDILALGVELRPATSIGPRLSLRDLKAQGYDAVFISTGSPRGRELRILGVELKGVYQGISLLRDSAAGRLPRGLFLGKRVVVIGGGGVAVDCARTSLRLAAKSVQMACLETWGGMPAHEWEIQAAVEEGVEVNCSWGPRQLLGQAEGRVSGVKLMRCTSVFDAQGRFNPTLDECVETLLEADVVILSIGQATDLSFLEGSNVQTIPRGTIKVNQELGTAEEGVFAGGEVVSGPASVIEAIAAGRQAAISIDKYLGGQGLIEEHLLERDSSSACLGREEGFADMPRSSMPTLNLQERLRSFSEVELGFDREAAMAEARRCLRCDLRLALSPVPLPPAREESLEFTRERVSCVPETEGVFQLLDEEKKVLYIRGTMNLRQELTEYLEKAKPPFDRARYFLLKEEPMYTARESELLQQFTLQYGRMPEGNGESEDLFD